MPNTNKPTVGFHTNPDNINRNGRPKREWTVAGLIEEAMENPVTDKDGNQIPTKKVVYNKLVEMAQAGDIMAIKEINQRLDGMPKQSIDNEHTGEITITIKDYGTDDKSST